MPPKAAAEKKPAASKAPVASKAPAEKKDAGKKAVAGDNKPKKRSKARKETYSSYIYKGESTNAFLSIITWFQDASLSARRVCFRLLPRRVINSGASGLARITRPHNQVHHFPKTSR